MDLTTIMPCIWQIENLFSDVLSKRVRREIDLEYMFRSILRIRQIRAIAVEILGGT